MGIGHQETTLPIDRQTSGTAVRMHRRLPAAEKFSLGSEYLDTSRHIDDVDLIFGVDGHGSRFLEPAVRNAASPPNLFEPSLRTGLIDAAGGQAYLYGISSGACLAMEASIRLGDKVKKLAMYEAPYDSDEARRQAFRNYRKQLAQAIAEGRKGDAVGLFMMFVGMPPEHLEGARQMPMWPMWEAVGQTLAYDAAAMGDDGAVPSEKAARVTVPTLVMDGSASFPFMHTTAMALAKAMPHAEQRTLEGQTHEVSAEALAPVLVEFFSRP